MSLLAMFRALGAALVSTAVLCPVALASSPPAVAKWGTDEPCVSSAAGTLKQQYGYSVAIITSDCTQIPAGERWAVSVPWIMADTFEQKPPGFATDYATPIDDFRGKLESIEYVVDGASASESNRSFPADNKIWVGQLPEAPGLPAANSSNLGSHDPLPVGRHAAEVYWKLSGPVCDGFTADQATSCLPAGEVLVKQVAFQVVDPYAPPVRR